MGIKMAERRVLCFQTRMNAAESEVIRSAMAKDDIGPVIWQRRVLLAAAAMGSTKRAIFLKSVKV